MSKCKFFSSTFQFVAIYLLVAGTTVSIAQELQTVEEYLDSVNYGKILFEGEVAYDKGDDQLRLYLTSGYFRAVSDAGRDVREQIQEKCVVYGMFARDNLCQIQGEGTVEIRGSDIWISIDKVNTLKK